MPPHKADAAYWGSVLDASPVLRRTVSDFMMCMDAKRVLERHQPPMYETAAAYLEEVGRELMSRAGLPEDFVQACIDNQPPHE